MLAIHCWRVFFFLLFYVIPRIKGLLHSDLAFLSSRPFLEVLSLSILRMVPSILQWGRPRYLSLWWDSSYRAWFWEAFSFVWDILFQFFSFITSWCLLSIFPSTYKFLFLRVFCFFLGFLVIFFPSFVFSASYN